MAAPVRFELTHRAVRAHCLTAWLWSNKYIYILKQNIKMTSIIMEVVTFLYKLKKILPFCNIL